VLLQQIAEEASAVVHTAGEVVSACVIVAFQEDDGRALCAAADVFILLCDGSDRRRRLAGHYAGSVNGVKHQCCIALHRTAIL
jgi:hypothetical protein